MLYTIEIPDAAFDATDTDDYKWVAEVVVREQMLDESILYKHLISSDTFFTVIKTDCSLIAQVLTAFARRELPEFRKMFEASHILHSL